MPTSLPSPPSGQFDRPFLVQAPPAGVDDDDVAQAVIEAGLRGGAPGQAVGEVPHGLVHEMGEVPVTVPGAYRYQRVLEPVGDIRESVVRPVVVDLARLSVKNEA